MEKILLDDVNVSECLAYKNKHCIDKTSIMFCETNLCSNYPNCYYKQLKRLEQENEELKEEIKLIEKMLICMLIYSMTNILKGLK